jgi:hypothetical protein
MPTGFVMPAKYSKPLILQRQFMLSEADKVSKASRQVAAFGDGQWLSW